MMDDKSTAIMVMPTGSDLEKFFTSAETADPILEQIKKAVRAHKPDVTTAKGRDEIKSLAYKVARTKTAIDEARKTLTADARDKIAKINEAGKGYFDTLEALQKEARKPLDDWEEKQAEIKARGKAALTAVRDHGISGSEPSVDILDAANRIKEVEIGDDLGEMAGIISDAREASLATLRVLYAAAIKREDDLAELEQLRQEKADREAADALRKQQEEEAERLKVEKEREEREAREAEERRKRDAEYAERRRVEEEARIEREKAEAAERAVKEAEERAAREKEEADKRHREELERAKQREQEATQRERDRIAAEKKAEDDARAAREADQKNRDEARAGIVAFLLSLPKDGRSAEHIADAIMAGEMPRVKVEL